MSRHMMATRMPRTHESCASLRLCTIGLGAWISISLPTARLIISTQHIAVSMLLHLS